MSFLYPAGDLSLAVTNLYGLIGVSTYYEKCYYFSGLVLSLAILHGALHHFVEIKEFEVSLRTKNLLGRGATMTLFSVILALKNVSYTANNLDLLVMITITSLIGIIPSFLPSRLNPQYARACYLICHNCLHLGLYHTFNMVAARAQ